MPSFYEKAKKEIIENKELLNIFDDFIRTGDVSKRSFKKRVNFTIDEDLFNVFRNYCMKENISMSGKIEKYIKQEIGKK